MNGVSVEKLSLSPAEQRAYPRWYTDLLLRKRHDTVAVGDLLRFVDNFGIGERDKQRISNFMDQPLVVVEPAQFYIFLRLCGHLLQGQQLRKELAFVTAPVPKPRPILSKRKQNEDNNPFSKPQEATPANEMDSFMSLMGGGSTSSSKGKKAKKRVTFDEKPPEVAEAAERSMQELLRQRAIAPVPLAAPAPAPTPERSPQPEEVDVPIPQNQFARVNIESVLHDGSSTIPEPPPPRKLTPNMTGPAQMTQMGALKPGAPMSSILGPGGFGQTGSLSQQSTGLQQQGTGLQPQHTGGLTQQHSGLRPQNSGLSQQATGPTQQHTGSMSIPSLNQQSTGFGQSAGVNHGLQQQSTGLSQQVTGIQQQPSGLSQQSTGYSQYGVSPQNSGISYASSSGYQSSIPQSTVPHLTVPGQQQQMTKPGVLHSSSTGNLSHMPTHPALNMQNSGQNGLQPSSLQPTPTGGSSSSAYLQPTHTGSPFLQPAQAANHGGSPQIRQQQYPPPQPGQYYHQPQMYSNLQASGQNTMQTSQAQSGLYQPQLHQPLHQPHQQQPQMQMQAQPNYSTYPPNQPGTYSSISTTGLVNSFQNMNLNPQGPLQSPPQHQFQQFPSQQYQQPQYPQTYGGMPVPAPPPRRQ